MADQQEYIPLDVSSISNARAESIAAMAAPVGSRRLQMTAAEVGRLTFRGLPFLIGRPDASPADADLAILGGDASTPVSVQVGRAARWLIFVHRLLDTARLRGRTRRRVGRGLRRPVRRRRA